MGTKDSLRLDHHETTNGYSATTEGDRDRAGRGNATSGLGHTRGGLSVNRRHVPHCAGSVDLHVRAHVEANLVKVPGLEAVTKVNVSGRTTGDGYSPAYHGVDTHSVSKRWVCQVCERQLYDPPVIVGRGRRLIREPHSFSTKAAQSKHTKRYGEVRSGEGRSEVGHVLHLTRQGRREVVFT